MSSRVIRTYGSRSARPAVPPSSPPSALASSPAAVPVRPRAKRVLEDHNSSPAPIAKRARITPTAKKPAQKQPALKQSAQRKLTQLHFIPNSTTLRTCPRCALSYTVGAPDDEALHRTHCARVQRGMEWRRADARAAREVAADVALADGRSARIVAVPAHAPGSKIAALLETVDRALAAPPMPPNALRDAQVYLLLFPAGPARETIAGCLVAQRITHAMAVVSAQSPPPSADGNTDDASPAMAHSTTRVDAGAGVFCDPTQLPTPMGVARLFVPAAHRRAGIARHLLDTAAATFVHGCALDARRGEVAFSQPTGAGAAVMRAWGGGGARVFAE